MITTHLVTTGLVKRKYESFDENEKTSKNSRRIFDNPNSIKNSFRLVYFHQRRSQLFSFPTHNDWWKGAFQMCKTT